MSAPGRLIAVSGTDGSGKTTLAKGLRARLESAGIRTVGVAPLKPEFAVQDRLIAVISGDYRGPLVGAPSRIAVI